MHYSELLTTTLVNLREAVRSIKDESDLKSTMHKYNMLILGGKFNTVYARELHLYMRDTLGLSMIIDDFLNFIPSVCQSLGMGIEPMKSANDLDKLADYQITLF